MLSRSGVKPGHGMVVNGKHPTIHVFMDLIYLLEGI
jgi:hypothetical protein